MREKNPVTSDQLSRLEKSLFELSGVIQKHHEVVQDRFHVSAVEIEILRLLVDEGDKKMKDIGECVRVKLSNLTNIVDRLEDRKLVKRINSKEDRRSVFVQVTPRGQKLLENYGTFLRELSTRMKQSMKDDQFVLLVDGLEKIARIAIPG